MRPNTQNMEKMSMDPKIMGRLLRALLILIFVANLASAQVLASPQPEPAVTRTAPLEVKVVFIGIDPSTVDSQYIKWNKNQLSNLPPVVTNQIQMGGNDTGVFYELAYEPFFASSDFKDRFVSYLKSIQTTVTSENRWFYYWKWEDRWTRVYKDVKNTLYDANEVESWLYENSREFGGFPENGWTFIISYLPELPSITYKQYKGYFENKERKETSTPHYYTVSYEDADRGYKPRNQDFMTGWGGRHRFWYLDLSAGPTFWSRWDLPLQVALEDLNIDIATPYGKKWFTEYLADYLFAASLNFAVPQFVYDPILTQKYEFIINVFDDRTSEEKTAVPVATLVNGERIRAAFKDLTPYAEVEVRTVFKDTSEYPDLQKLLKDQYHYLDSWTYWYEWDEPQDYGSVDMRPVYNYLQDNLATFVPNIKRDEKEFTVPAFVFAFSEKTYFTFGYKWFMDSRNPETGQLWGMACGDMTIIGMPQHDFRMGDEEKPKQLGKGYGLTYVIIHELGHMVGLMHPHSFDWLGDFSSSAMSYFTYDYGFGQFDKDALQRIHADKAMMEASSTVRNAREILQGKVESADTNALLDKADRLLEEADAEYSKMNYAEAVKKALDARESSIAGLAKAEGLPIPEVPVVQVTQRATEQVIVPISSTYVIIGIVVGLAVGCVATWVILRRRATPRIQHRTEISPNP